ncbi:insulinase family protein [soil metagenome]
MNRTILSTASMALFGALALVGCSPSARTAGGPAPLPSDAPLPTDPQVRTGTLENGLRFYIRQNAEPRNRAELRLAVNAGSLLEDEDQRGLAHFVEHMAFNGTRNFAKHELVDYLESVGMRFGPDVNAYTSFDETVYMLTLPTDSAGVVETGLQILEDWAHGIAFDSLEVEKERGVVIEEWRLGQGAGTRMRDRQFPVLFGGSRYAERLPIGTRESLESFDHEALERFYREWYRPELMSVVVVGDVDPDRIEALIRTHFGSIPAAENPRPRPEYGVPGHDSTRVSVATDREATSASVSVYLKQPAREGGTPRAYRNWITESLASAMLNSRLHELSQEPDAPVLNVSSFQGRMVRPIDAFVLSAVVPDAGVLPGTGALFTELLRAERHGFTATELEREKTELLRIMEQRHAERAKTTSAEYAGQYVSHFLYGGALIGADTEWTLYRQLVPQVTLGDVNAVAGSWVGARDRVVLVSAPERDGVVVPNESAVATMVDERAGGETLMAYDDGAGEAPLMAAPPAPGEIRSERTVAEIGVTEWTLTNGVRVILKPTDFKNDEILLAARSPGGTSRVADEDYLAALTSTAVVQAGGVGEHTVTELRKRLAGQMAGAGADIGELHEGLSGAASPRDVETLFQLIYLRFTAPRMDSTAFLAYRSQAREMMRNRGLSPEAAFSDTLQVTLAQGHPRARPPSVALFDSLDLHRSFEIYRDRFADAGDFTFYIVGNFAPDSIRPHVERYLGSLPSLGREESWRDVGVRPPPGVVRKTVRRGTEPKARTQIVFHGPLEFGREELSSLNALAEVLQIRLREVRREDLGGTYGVGVQASGARDPEPSYRLTIGFGAAPERLDELVRVTFAELESLQRNGPREADLAKVREMQFRAREVRLRENNFWISQLMTYDRYGWDTRQIPVHERSAERLSAERVRDAARRYVDTRRYVQVSLVPEGEGESGVADR